MIYISVHPNTRAVPRTGDKNPAASSSQNNGVIKKQEKYLRNFQAVLVTTGVAMLQGVAPETPTHKTDCAFPVGWGWIPPQIRQSSWQGVPTHPGREFSPDPALPGGLDHPLGNSSLYTYVRIPDHGLSGLAISAQHWAGTQAEVTVCEQVLEVSRSSLGHQGHLMQVHRHQKARGLELQYTLGLKT